MAAASTAGSAVFAFNVITVEHAEGIAAGAERTGAGAVIQLSENTIRYHGGRMTPLLAACERIAADCRVPLALHLDHFQDTDLIHAAIADSARHGVSSIMVDAAHLPYADNVERTRSLAQSAHDAGLYVEAELGEIGGKAGAHAPGVRTDPAEAADFSRATGVDALAVAVGSTHAMTTRDAVLDIALIGRLADSVAVPLVLHGSSGVPDDQLRRAVDAGIRKVNVGTALNVAYTAAIRKNLSLDEESTDPRRYLTVGRQAVADTVAQLCLLVAERNPA